MLANELQTDACSWRTYAKQCAGRGYRVLTIDFNSDDIAGFVPGSTNHGDIAAARRLPPQIEAQMIHGRRSPDHPAAPTRDRTASASQYAYRNSMARGRASDGAISISAGDITGRP